MLINHNLKIIFIPLNSMAELSNRFTPFVYISFSQMLRGGEEGFKKTHDK